jgi:hypothetical protein
MKEIIASGKLNKVIISINNSLHNEDIFIVTPYFGVFTRDSTIYSENDINFNNPVVIKNIWLRGRRETDRNFFEKTPYPLSCQHFAFTVEGSICDFHENTMVFQYDDN